MIRFLLSALVAVVAVSAGTLALSLYEIPLWPCVVMLILISQLYWQVSSLREVAIPLTFGYAGLFTAGWIKSFPEPEVAMRSLWLMPASVTVCLTLGFVGVVTAISDQRKRSSTMAAAFAIGLASLVALFSGNGGGPDPMMHWLLDHGFSQGQADMAVFACRKTIHFTFYAVMATAAYYAGRGSGNRKATIFALAYGLSHALFDEIRQRFASGRAGSPVDVLLDFTGMLAALFLLGAFRSQKEPAS